VSCSRARRPRRRGDGEPRRARRARLGAVDHKQHPLLGVEAALDQIREQRRRDRRVLARTLPETERDLDPVGRDAERDVRPFNSIPSSISTARRTSSSRRPISSPSATRVRSTNARDIDDLLIERAACSSSTPTGSCVRR